MGGLIGKKRVVDEIKGGLNSSVRKKLGITVGVYAKLDFETSDAYNLKASGRII